MTYIVFFISAILGTLYLITIFKDAIKRKIDLKFYQVALYSLHAYAPTIMGRAATDVLQWAKREREAWL